MDSKDDEIKQLQTHIKYLERENRFLRMQLIDDYAKAACVGLYANPETSELTHEETAKWTFDAADALMAERERRYGP